MTDLIQIRTSDRVAFKTCRLKWYFASPLRMNLEPNIPPPFLALGSAVHHGLEKRHDPDGPQTLAYSLQEYDKYVREHLQSYQSIYGDLWPEEKDTWHEQYDLGRNMLIYYDKFWQKNLQDFKHIWVEKDLVIEIPGLEGFAYGARLDGLVQDEWGDYWILEYKTTAQFPNNLNYLSIDDQTGSYIWLVQQLMGIPVKGVLYIWLRKSLPHAPKVLKNGSLSVNKQQDTDLETFLEAVLQHHDGEIPDHYNEYIEWLKENQKQFIMFELVERNKFEINGMAERITAEARDMTSDPAIYPNPSRANCQTCWFFDLCQGTLDGSDADYIRQNQYRVRDKYSTRLTLLEKENQWL